MGNGVTTNPTSRAHLIASIVLRSLILILSLTVAGIYGHDLDNYRKNNLHAPSAWIFAVVTAGLTALTQIIYMFPKVRSWWGWIWDWVLFVFWTALFGVFADKFDNGRMNCGMYQKEGGAKGFCERMKAGVWIDLVGMLAVFASAVVGTFMWWRERHSRSMFTGRSAVV